jgi:hypothetical protein
MKGNENITQKVTTIKPEYSINTGSDEKNKKVNKRDNDPYNKPIKNIFQGPFSALLGLISDSNMGK